jgi:hypothetical protein
MGEQLDGEDQAAIGWALATRSPTGAVVAGRIRRGEPPLSDRDVRAMRDEWEAAGRPHHTPHVHQDDVTFPDGTTVTAVTFAAPDPYVREAAPSFGLYLDERWDPPWPHETVLWPDFGVPPDAPGLAEVLARLLVRARSGEAVELGCAGGHGRTGTALACLAVLTGVEAGRAVEWVRRHYCADAVETDEQERFVLRFASH